MTLKEAMAARHTVRSYRDDPIPAETAAKLEARLAAHNEQQGLSMQLAVGDKSAFGALLQLVLAKNVQNYILLAGPEGPGLDEKLGYCSADLMLYAQTLGLNSWWVGGTFSRKNMAKKADGRVLGVVAVGYGRTQGVPHKSKRPDEVGAFAGSPPDWFTEGVKAALLAPTALNKQAFFIEGRDNCVSISCNNGIFSGADLGIVKYHFELGAGSDNFTWE